MIRPSDVTAFVPTWNRPVMLRRMLRSFAATFPNNPTPEVIVWDDASDDIDAVYDAANNAHENNSISMVQANSKTSLAHIWNQGVMLSATPYVLFLNDDLEFLSGDWWPAFCEKLEGAGGEEPCDEVRADFGMLMLPVATICKIGWFDERFPGITFEDHDWVNRVEEAGLRSHNFGDRHAVLERDPDDPRNCMHTIASDGGMPWVYHDHAHPEFNGSAPEVEARKLLNRECYFRKWSGLPAYVCGRRPRRMLPEVDWFPGYRETLVERARRDPVARRGFEPRGAT